LKLSESFRNSGELGLGKGDSLFLKLQVKVYNMNRGHNAEIIRGCKPLEGYSILLASFGSTRGEVKGGKKQ
jgi:hypothetical protein